MGENIFDKYLDPRSSSELFRENGRSILSSDYIPNELPHRKAQINQLANILSPAFKGSLPLNILMYGKTGTGKTAVTLNVAIELVNKKKELEADVNCLYNNCLANTTYGILAKLTNVFRDEGDEVPSTGWPISRVYEALKSELHGINIVILDEIDKLLAKNKGQGNQLLYLLTNINSEIEEGKVSLIGISNDLTYTHNLEKKVLGRVRGETIIFKPYDAVQLKDILESRVKLAFHSGVVDHSIIGQCAATAAQKNGDARYALRLLRKAGDVAEQNKAVKVLTDHVKQAEKALEESAIKEGVLVLSQPQKHLLATLLLSKQQLTTGQVYAQYVNLCRTLGVEHLTQRRITDFISEFDEAGLVNAPLKGFGRGKGRTRVVWLDAAVPVDETLEWIVDGIDEEIRPRLERLLQKREVFRKQN